MIKGQGRRERPGEETMNELKVTKQIEYRVTVSKLRNEYTAHVNKFEDSIAKRDGETWKYNVKCLDTVVEFTGRSREKVLAQAQAAADRLNAPMI